MQVTTGEKCWYKLGCISESQGSMVCFLQALYVGRTIPTTCGNREKELIADNRWILTLFKHINHLFFLWILPFVVMHHTELLNYYYCFDFYPKSKVIELRSKISVVYIACIKEPWTLKIYLSIVHMWICLVFREKTYNFHCIFIKKIWMKNPRIK